MAEEKKIVRLADVGELEADLKKDLAEEEAKGKAADILFCESIEDELSDLSNLPTIDPKTLRPVAHWGDVPGSYKDHIGKDGSWFVPTTRCTNPEDMAHYLMDFCHDHLAAGKGCQGCPFNRPSTKECGGACRLVVPSNWDF